MPGECRRAAKASQKRALRLLTAPVDGTVQQLAIHTIGGIVTAAEQLIVIVPKDSKLEIKAMLPNKDVGFVHKGQDAEIKVEAVTFTRYGLLRGTVTSISRDTVTTQDAAVSDRNSRADASDPPKDKAEGQFRQAAYVAHVLFNEAAIETEDWLTPLEPDMAVITEIKTGQRTVSVICFPHSCATS